MGKLVPSLISGTNAALIAAIAPLYLDGTVLDTTYGRGKWWDRFRPDDLVTHDLALDGVDFRDLPHDDASFDAVCFDPPYVPRHGGNLPPSSNLVNFRNRYGLAEPRTRAELEQLIVAGLGECARVARRWLLVKCCDYVNGKQFHLGHLVVIQTGTDLGIRTHDLIVHAAGTGPGGSQIFEQQRARRAHSYLIVFDVAPLHRARPSASAS